MINPQEFKQDVFDWAAKVGVEPKEVHIREMSKKVASCSTKGRLTFAKSLLGSPREKQDYAIVHELLHLKYPNHGKMFKSMLNAHLNKGANRGAKC